jgi:ubiquinone/menaquinone biosynthesis C-methylase UbiE
VRFAVALVDPKPGQRLLEIGCGPGVAAALVCPRVDPGGHLLAVDRSPVAVRCTAERNAAHVDAGILTVRQAALEELDLPAAGLDAAFAVNVNLFWTRRCDRELATLVRALRPGGRLHVCYGAAGPTGPRRVTDAVGAALRAAGLREVAVVADAGGFAISGTAPGAGPSALQQGGHAATSLQ